jgi:hypothetical protein
MCSTRALSTGLLYGWMHSLLLAWCNLPQALVEAIMEIAGLLDICARYNVIRACMSAGEASLGTSDTMVTCHPHMCMFSLWLRAVTRSAANTEAHCS